MVEAITDNVILNVGYILDMRKDKTVALERARRGVRALGLEWVDLVQKDRRGYVADTRHMVSKYLRDCGYTFREISECLGRINHTTSCYSVRQCNNLLEIDADYRRNYEIFMNA